MQIIAHFHLLDSLIPANMRIVLDTFYEIATFDIIPIEYFTQPIVDALSVQERSSNKDFQQNINTIEAGYDTTNPFFNMTEPISFYISLTVILLTLVGVKYLSWKSAKF